MSVNTMSTPTCFGNPKRCRECVACDVKMACYEKQQKDFAVFLLPKDRPAPKDEKPPAARYVKEAPVIRVEDATDQEDD